LENMLPRILTSLVSLNNRAPFTGCSIQTNRFKTLFKAIFPCQKF
jgi:hypothetical protein